MTKEEVLTENNRLYDDLDKCISYVIMAKQSKSKLMKIAAWNRMEQRLVETLQHLTVVNDYLTENKEKI